jgi:hypothetical protein
MPGASRTLPLQATFSWEHLQCAEPLSDHGYSE